MTTADRVARGASGARGGFLARHPLFSYSVIAYAITWLAWSPLLLSQDGLALLPFSSPLGVLASGALGTVGPSVAALVVTGATEGRRGVRRLLGSVVLWRVGPRWYLFSLLGIPAVLTLGAVVVPGTLTSFEPTDPLPMLVSYLPFFVYPALIIGGPLGEEPGWRGFALPRLQRRHGPLVGSLILSPLWAFWHVPVWLTAWRAAGMLDLYNLVVYVLFITVWTIVMTWVFNNTRGSVLMAILLHTSVDAFPNAILWPLLPASNTVTDYGVLVGYFGMVVGLGTVALAVVWSTRGGLGYRNRGRGGDPEAVSAPV